MFLEHKAFDLAIIKWLRSSVKNFIINHDDMSINGLPLEVCPVVEANDKAQNLKEYIDNILMA